MTTFVAPDQYGIFLRPAPSGAHYHLSVNMPNERRAKQFLISRSPRLDVFIADVAERMVGNLKSEIHEMPISRQYLVSCQQEKGVFSGGPCLEFTFVPYRTEGATDDDGHRIEVPSAEVALVIGQSMNDVSSFGRVTHRFRFALPKHHGEEDKWCAKFLRMYELAAEKLGAWNSSDVVDASP